MILCFLCLPVCSVYIHRQCCPTGLRGWFLSAPCLTTLLLLFKLAEHLKQGDTVVNNCLSRAPASSFVVKLAYKKSRRSSPAEPVECIERLAVFMLLHQLLQMEKQEWKLENLQVEILSLYLCWINSRNCTFNVHVSWNGKSCWLANMRSLGFWLIQSSVHCIHIYHTSLTLILHPW